MCTTTRSSGTFISYIHQLRSSVMFISYVHQLCSLGTFIHYVHQLRSSVTFIRYVHQLRSSVTFISYAYKQRIGKTNNLKLKFQEHKTFFFFFFAYILYITKILKSSRFTRTEWVIENNLMNEIIINLDKKISMFTICSYCTLKTCACICIQN